MMFNDRNERELICEVGRRLYNRGFAAANDGNISIRIGDDRFLCTPTGVSKGFMKPEDLCIVDSNGDQVAGVKKRTSEIKLHLSVYKARKDIMGVVHCHPPHATAFAVPHEQIPKCVLPEVEVFLGEVQQNLARPLALAGELLAFVIDEADIVGLEEALAHHRLRTQDLLIVQAERDVSIVGGGEALGVDAPADLAHLFLELVFVHEFFLPFAA